MTVKASTTQKVVLLVVSLGSAQSALTLASIQIAIPEITQEFQPSAVQVSWIPMAFLLANAISIIPMGRYADAIGRKRLFLTGMLLFALGNLLASIASSIEWLLACRALQGFATAMLHATGMAIIASVFPEAKRGKALGVAAAAIYLGLSMGPVLGGLLTEFAGWRSVFQVQVPLAILNCFLVVRYIRQEWRADEPIGVDWTGVFWLACMLGSLVVAASLPASEQQYQGQLLLLGAGIAAGVVLYYHLGRAHQPLVNLSAIRGNSTYLTSLGAAFFVYAGNYTAVFLVSLYLQFLVGLSPAIAGLTVLAQTLAIAVVSLFVSRLETRWAPHSIVGFGCGLVAISFAILSVVRPDGPLAIMVAALLLNGIGMGMFTTPNNSAALGSVNPQRLSAATAILNLARYLGNMLGTAVVLMLMAALIGQNSIQPDQYPALQKVVQYAFTFALLSAGMASFVSFKVQR